MSPLNAMHHSYPAWKPKDMIAYPPSPALSYCDSLDDIDDLDAYLDAQGQLSHFPTPPLPDKDQAIVPEEEIDISDGEDGLDYYHIATLFTRNASIGVEFSDTDVWMIERILIRAGLPPEVLALAYNIICGLDCDSLPVGSFYSAPNDLIVVTALSLAVSYTSDCPPTVRYWSRHVCDGTWTAIRIDKTTLQVYAALGWRLHEYSAPDAIRRAMAEFVPCLQARTLEIRAREPPAADVAVIEALKLVVGGTSAYWMNGQVTPDGTPPHSEFVGDENRFLPLL